MSDIFSGASLNCVTWSCQRNSLIYAYYNILLPIPTDGIYTYRYQYDILPGQRVTVPFGKRFLTGICLGSVNEPEFECRDIDAVLDEIPLFPNVWLDFIKYISSYYASPLGSTLHGVLSQKLLSSLPPEKSFDLEISDGLEIGLSAEQREAADNIDLNSYSVHLIQGITGSGKTEIYLELIKRTIAKGKQAIYLVPEISLTPQLVERLRERLGFAPAVFHSKLTDKKRHEAFWRFAHGEHPLLIGARSALFVPTTGLGIIIVDEEHENTYKQEEAPSYHLRDMAVLYARMNNLPVVLGSATPQAESIANSRIGKYKIHYLRERHAGASLPEINIVDMKLEPLVGGVLAESVYDRLYNTVREGQQAIIFLNRKGYATALFCRKCGKLQECTNCSVPLTMYKTSGRSVCHYCGTEYRKIRCGCGGEEVFDGGLGTERVEEFLQQMFPDNIVRIDADKINTFKQLGAALDVFYRKDAQVLVGTQLIAKGLHFPEVTFVGILGIDNILSIPDYRAVEKAYQLVMQVSGRAGRGDVKGNVYIQTHIPEHPIFQYFSAEPETFYDYELERRRQFDYPPYTRMARIVFAYSKQAEIKNLADTIMGELHRINKGAVILGPAPAVVYKIKNQYRFSVIIKSRSHQILSELLSKARDLFEHSKKGTMQMKIDRDPYYFM